MRGETILYRRSQELIVEHIKWSLDKLYKTYQYRG